MTESPPRGVSTRRPHVAASCDETGAPLDETGERHEPGLLGQMLAHLMANAARGDEVARNLLECLEEEVEGVMRRLGEQEPL